MNCRFGFVAASLAASAFCGSTQTISTTPTFNNLGVVVNLSAPATQSVVRVFVKPAGAPTNDFREAHPLSRLTATRFAGSVFALTPGTSYDFKLTSAAFAADQFFSATTRS